MLGAAPPGVFGDRCREPPTPTIPWHAFHGAVDGLAVGPRPRPGAGVGPDRGSCLRSWSLIDQSAPRESILASSVPQPGMLLPPTVASSPHALSRAAFRAGA